MPKISVVIPCFNQGAYIPDALNSVLAQSYRDFEIIVINDGSTDRETTVILEQLAFPKTRVVHTSNQGLAAARNNGIREALGNYILPLDADDRISPAYLEKAAAVLDIHPEVGFVYSLARLFGARRGMFYLNEGTLGDMLLDSRIFCSALFRKADWEAAGGYNANMLYGWEDWDFWLSLLEQGKTSYLIPEVLFHYRVKKNSMIRAMSLKEKLAMHQQLFDNHRDLYCQNIGLVFEEYHRLKDSWYGKLSELIRKIFFNLKHLGK
jgi:glycosyltransferase involved in cell wall biosynthesis